MRALVAKLCVGALACLCGRAQAETVDAVAARYHLAGELLVARGDRVILDKGFGTVTLSGKEPHKAGARWRLASITKQVTAAMLVHDAYAGGVPLDQPLGPFMEKPTLGNVTTRQLLQHHSGLANPDTTAAGSDGVPSFYKATKPDFGFCLSKAASPGGAFAYDNCDYIIASILLVGRMGEGRLWPEGMELAEAGETGVPGFVGGKPEPSFQLAAWGAAGALMGTANALFDFDRSLITGKLLPSAALAELWKPEGHGSYQALGQWVFPGQLKGCAAPKRIVQRDGEIYGVQTRNYILPDDGIVVIAFTNRSADDFDFGEIWQSKGFAYDLLSAVACA